MNKILSISTIVLALIAGLIGGVLGAKLFMAQPQEQMTLTSLTLKSQTKEVQPAIAMTDQNGTLRFFVSLDSDGEPNLVLSDKNGKSRAVLGTISVPNEGFFGATDSIVKRPASSLVLMDKEGRIVWQTP